MSYFVVTVVGNNNEIISEHSTLKEARDAGEKLFEKMERRVMVTCIGANETLKKDTEGRLIGKYRLFNVWF